MRNAAQVQPVDDGTGEKVHDFGTVRQQVIAAAFGVGAAYDAYNYAYVLPGFLLILLGGINGPFHSAMVSVLAKIHGTESTGLNLLMGSSHPDVKQRLEKARAAALSLRTWLSA